MATAMVWSALKNAITGPALLLQFGAMLPTCKSSLLANNRQPNAPLKHQRVKMSPKFSNVLEQVLLRKQAGLNRRLVSQKHPRQPVRLRRTLMELLVYGKVIKHNRLSANERIMYLYLLRM